TSVPDILKKVFDGFKVNYDGIQGTFDKRDYCVQYRESDFAFASRLMEEEGIYYFFKFSESGEQLMLANSPQGHPDIPGTTPVLYKYLSPGEEEKEDMIVQWSKTQELASGKFTLWDHCFELPGQNLE